VPDVVKCLNLNLLLLIAMLRVRGVSLIGDFVMGDFVTKTHEMINYVQHCFLELEVTGLICSTN
jgi:hypothetical protein